LLSIVLIPLRYVALLRLMMGSSVGEELGARRALSCGWKRLAQAIVVGLSATLILAAALVPLAIVFVVLVTAHDWQIGIVVGAIGIILVYAPISLSIAVLMGEGATGFEATGRSWRMAMHSPRLVIGALGIVILLGNLVSVVLIYVVSHSLDGGSEPLVSGIVSLVTAALVTPITGAFIASTYLEVRARIEAVTSAGSLAFALRTGDP
jgi:hypothetical protein